MEKSEKEIKQSAENNQEEIENLMDTVIIENIEALKELAK